MKKVILIFVLALSFTTEAQTTPFVEFTESNFCLTEIKKTVEPGQSILYLIDANNPADIRTYIFLQKEQGVTLSPSIPSGWVIKFYEYEQKTELLFYVNQPTKYVNDNQGSSYLKIN